MSSDTQRRGRIVKLTDPTRPCRSVRQSRISGLDGRALRLQAFVNKTHTVQYRDATSIQPMLYNPLVQACTDVDKATITLAQTDLRVASLHTDYTVPSRGCRDVARSGCKRRLSRKISCATKCRSLVATYHTGPPGIPVLKAKNSPPRFVTKFPKENSRRPWYHRPLKIKTGGVRPRLREFGSIDC